MKAYKVVRVSGPDLVSALPTMWIKYYTDRPSFPPKGTQLFAFTNLKKATEFFETIVKYSRYNNYQIYECIVVPTKSKKIFKSILWSEIYTNVISNFLDRISQLRKNHKKLIDAQSNNSEVIFCDSIQLVGRPL